ncbi:MAG: glycosyltransferase family 4 protein [Actinomycetes bacterium]
MRVAIVHSFYSSDVPSGENLAVLRQVDALTEAGHDVHLVARYTDELSGSPLYQVTSALHVATGYGGDPSDELRAIAPDVVHVHNLFPNFGTKWLANWDGPLVATLHNFRPLCANGLLYRDGGVCTACPDGSTLHSLQHKCYRESAVATLPLAISLRGGVTRNHLLARADKVIVLSERARLLYEWYGLPSPKLVVVPNGLNIPAKDGVIPENERWVAVGRFTPEKGLLDLVSQWPGDRWLDVIGAGPELGLIETVAPHRVRIVPPLPNSDLLEMLPTYSGLILPSKWFEGLPTVIVEALGSAVPVAARSGNSASDVLEAYEPSWVYDGSTPSLEAALSAISTSGLSARLRARELFEREFMMATWIDRLELAYTGAGAPSAVEHSPRPSKSTP